jgi:hypothetical protein
MFSMLTVTWFGLLYSSCPVYIRYKVYQVEGSAVQAVDTTIGVKIIITQYFGIILK